MTLVEKIKKLIWHNNPIKAKEILLEMVQSIMSLQTSVEDLESNQGGSGIESITGEYVNNTDPLNPILNDPRPYRVYTALLSQTGTSAPTVIELENTLELSPLFSRSNVGRYSCDFQQSLLRDKVTIDIKNTSASAFGGTAMTATTEISISNIDEITGFSIATNATSTVATNATDNTFNKSFFEIRAYN